jgi:hypothetical protein
MNYSTLPVRDLAGCHGYAGYNLPEGRLEASAERQGFGHAVATDRFEVVGPPAGTPLSFLARLSVNGVAFTLTHGFDSACLSIFVSDGVHQGSASACGTYGNSLLWTTSIAIPLQHNAHEQFAITYALGANATLDAEAWARGESAGAFLSFEDLPQGARVMSCQGYVRDTPVAARGLTWGALKTRYR